MNGRIDSLCEASILSSMDTILGYMKMKVHKRTDENMDFTSYNVLNRFVRKAV